MKMNLILAGIFVCVGLFIWLPCCFGSSGFNDALVVPGGDVSWKRVWWQKKGHLVQKKFVGKRHDASVLKRDVP